MFYTPKPRQFRYQPRFYDPERERWEALKQKYADERMLREQLAEADMAAAAAGENPAAGASDADLAYFERRVREIDAGERAKKRGLTWRDLFRRREMPKFNYQPRFATEGEGESKPVPASEKTPPRKRHVKISRRFDIGDPDYLKPMPAGRVMLYALLVCVLLYWILN
ncbi:MAG: hypothetical protein IJU19_01185 [Bacteroidales bacterium]|nr:hypothetical protein [Bacteroidales bacterium]